MNIWTAVKQYLNVKAWVKHRRIIIKVGKEFLLTRLVIQTAFKVSLLDLTPVNQMPSNTKRLVKEARVQDSDKTKTSTLKPTSKIKLTAI